MLSEVLLKDQQYIEKRRFTLQDYWREYLEYQKDESKIQLSRTPMGAMSTDKRFRVEQQNEGIEKMIELMRSPLPKRTQVRASERAAVSEGTFYHLANVCLLQVDNHLSESLLDRFRSCSSRRGFGEMQFSRGLILILVE